MWRPKWKVELTGRACPCNIHLSYSPPCTFASGKSVRDSAHRVGKFILKAIEEHTFKCRLISKFKSLFHNCLGKELFFKNVRAHPQGFNRVKYFALRRPLGTNLDAKYKSSLKFSAQKLDNQASVGFIRVSSKKDCLLTNNIPILRKCFTSIMSSKEKSAVKRLKTNSEERNSQSDDADVTDISSVSEKLNIDQQIKNDRFSDDCQRYTKKPSVELECQESKVESSSNCRVTSKGHRQIAHLNELRQWEYTSYGKECDSGHSGKVNSHHFKLMSYNVLSQTLLENHPHLYYGHDPDALNWEWRSKALIKEIEAASPDILCLQEVQESHLGSFYTPELQKLGYSGIYKKRTGDKPDGVAIYYKVSAFCLEEHVSVEFMQPIMPVLNRDNVALIARFSSRVTPSLPHVCIATTHLLYNPRRMDVKLAQIQLLLAELERLAYVRNVSGESYHPIIITGDLNVTPKSSLYRLLTAGILWDNDITDEMFDILGITHNCQHCSILYKRQSSEAQDYDRNSELKDLKVYNSDYAEAVLKMNSRDESSEEVQKCLVGRRKGQLSHNFTLKSVYNHRNNRGKEATTHQDKWVTVDYIFYSCMARDLTMEPVEGNLKLLARYGLLCKEECFTYGPIPNLCSPSDHFPLLCKFSLTS